MKRTGKLLVAALLFTILAACNQTPSATVPAGTPTLRPPQVSTVALDAPEAAPTAAATSLPSPSASPSVEPTATQAASEPTATPTEAEADSSAPAATEPPAATAAATSQPTASACEDKAAFYDDVTVPDDTPFKQSVEFVKTWRIRNEGSCTWENYSLVSAGGSIFDAPLTNPIPGVIHPGDLVDISLNMHSPNQGGLYTSLWEFENASGKRFGVNSGGIDKIWVRISVTWYPEGSTAPGVSPIPTPTGGCTLEKNQAYIDQLLSLINDVRAKNSLPALTLDPHLSAAAQVHSEDMACKNFMDHTGSDGSNWADRVKNQGYKFSYVSENIYAGDPTFSGDAQGAFDWWMNSKVHRDNILSPKVTQIGIGFASSPTAKYKGRYTLNFARP
jgi:uncharacterized protein YkwD